ncbi:isoprenyl transferase [Bacillus sp. CGMCC 1.16607]|uniref:isoprenyl transferase n=1 Tax=Bacillus sp. CGMCC 1.16607 TaxID=3351842 RepID=UPI00362F8C22
MELSIPSHIAIMMDGNGRWGNLRGLTRSQGHFAGSQTMEKIIYTSLELGIKVLSLYAFSTENWKRPKDEVQYLMDLPTQFFKEKLPDFMKRNIKICITGDIDGLPKHTQEAVKNAEKETVNNTDLIVNFALNYGGRSEILSAVKSMIKDVQYSTIAIEEIGEDLIEKYLFTKGLPSPDIIIRTGGERRISNYMLWQSAKSELWYTDSYFPDFDKQMLLQAIEEVNQRKLINKM